MSLNKHYIFLSNPGIDHHQQMLTAQALEMYPPMVQQILVPTTTMMNLPALVMSTVMRLREDAVPWDVPMVLSDTMMIELSVKESNHWNSLITWYFAFRFFSILQHFKAMMKQIYFSNVKKTMNCCSNQSVTVMSPAKDFHVLQEPPARLSQGLPGEKLSTELFAGFIIFLITSTFAPRIWGFCNVYKGSMI